jgi:ornithine cyclodeaminase
MSGQAGIRVIDGAAVRALLPYSECVPAVRAAMMAVSAGKALLPLRTGMRLPNGAGVLGQMPGYLEEPECFGIKLVSLFPGNQARGLSSHFGAYLLYDAGTGLPLALLNAGELTAIRTAAATTVATVALMRPDSRVLAVLGTGEQARAHIEALTGAHAFDRVLVWGRNREHAASLAASLTAARRDAGHAPIELMTSAPEAVGPADVICTVTAAKTPVLLGEWLHAGQHVNLVGASFPDAREIDDDGVVRSRVIVDYRTSALAQAGELLGAIRAGRITETHIAAEIGEVLSGARPGRQSAEQITLYKSLGVAAQDLAAAWAVLRAAERTGTGTVVHI